MEKIFNAKELLNGQKCGREETWLTIFDLGRHRMLNDLKKKIHDAGLKVEEFCQAVSIVYGDFFDRAAHGIPLPPEIQDKDILEVVELLEVDTDEPTTKTLDILIRKLSLVNDEDVDVSSKKDSSSDSNVSFRDSSKSADTSGSGNEVVLEN